MKFLYRPLRGTLEESMREVQEFDSIEAVRAGVYAEWNADGKVFDLSDVEVVLTEEVAEPKIGWYHVHSITIKRFGDEHFDTPQVIGHCEFRNTPDEQDLLGFDVLGIKYEDLAPAPNTFRKMMGLPEINPFDEVRRFDFDSMIGKPLQGVNDAITEWLTSVGIKPDDK